MPDERAAGELSYAAHQERLRRWVLYLWEPLRKAKQPKTKLAEALGLSKQTVGGYINETEKPGLECFIHLHFRQGLDPRRLLREEPPAAEAAPPVLIPTPEHRTKRAVRK